MRYGRVEVTFDYLQTILGFDGEIKPAKLLTDLPDDTTIKTMYVDNDRNKLVIILQGLAKPLMKTTEGAEIPIIQLEYETIERS